MSKKEYKHKPSMTTYSKMGELKPPPKVKLKQKKKKKKLPLTGIMTGHKVDSLGNKIPGTEMGPDTLYSKTITPEEFHSPKIKIKKKKSGGYKKVVKY